MPTSTWLIVPAAGSGQRFGSEQPKQLLTVAGHSVLAHSLQAFAGLIDGCIIATQQSLLAEIAKITKQVPFNCHVIEGGINRQGSVATALKAIPANADYVLVHDAARPCIHRQDIESCLTCLTDHRACVLARPCANTVKRAHGTQITETVPRDDLWLAETPQCFHHAIGIEAFNRAHEDGWTGTDDVSLIERLGIPVELVAASHPNPKLTTTDDATLIAAILDNRPATPDT